MERFSGFAVTALSIIVLCVNAVPVRAESILYWSDYNYGTDNMAAALAALPASYSVTTATSAADFDAKLNGGGYNLAIFGAQDFPGSIYGSVMSDLAAFVAAGGKSIVDDYDRADGPQLSPLGATYTGNFNDASVTVGLPAFAAGLGDNPIPLANTGWGVFSYGLNPNPGSTVAATFSDGEAAIVIDSTGRSIINGMLNDTFQNSPDGVQLYTNEIVTDPSPTPEPGSLTLLGLGLASIGGFGWMKKQLAV